MCHLTSTEAVSRKTSLLMESLESSSGLPKRARHPNTRAGSRLPSPPPCYTSPSRNGSNTLPQAPTCRAPGDFQIATDHCHLAGTALSGEGRKALARSKSHIPDVACEAFLLGLCPPTLDLSQPARPPCLKGWQASENSSSLPKGQQSLSLLIGWL